MLIKMSGRCLPAISLFFILTPLSVLVIGFSEASSSYGLATYWGTNVAEGSLREACSTNYYKQIVIAFLTYSGGTPVLNLSRHCDPALGNCKKFSSDIKYCQSQGIKVLLCLESGFGKLSPDLAETLARYLFYDFLSESYGPLGKVALDGIDLYIDEGGPQDFWVALASNLSQYSTPSRKIHLSAVAQHCCLNASSHEAIKTGLFDYVWVQFDNNPSCDIRAGIPRVLASWKDWSSYLDQVSPNTQLFMGLLASPAASDSGGDYIYPCVFVPEVLPAIKNSTNFGGLLLWNRYYDVQNGYSQQLLSLQSHKQYQLPLSQVV